MTMWECRGGIFEGCGPIDRYDMSVYICIDIRVHMYIYIYIYIYTYIHIYVMSL